MNDKHIELAKNASYSYRKINEELSEDILEFVGKRIESNKDNIEKLIKITRENIDLEKIRRFLTKESKYKSSKKILLSTDGFIKGTLITPKGVILRKESEVEKVIECYIDSILSRNSIIVADIDYSEISVKNLVLEIIKSSLKKFNIDENLIQLLPYEEVDDTTFNKYIETNEKYIYLENEEFINEVENKSDLIRGEIDEVIDRINEKGICKCAIIYTKDKEKGYKFINLVNGKNVFINTSYTNIEECDIDELYIYKNVIYPTK